LPGMRLYTSNRMEVLARELARVLGSPPASPLDTEIIVVQSRGMERWVRMALARHHGVCANMRFPFPNAIVREIYSRVFPDLPEHDPMDPDIMTWKIMGLLPSCMSEPEFEEIRFYLGSPLRHLKWFQLAARIADTFDQYTLFRPDMVMGWEAEKENHWQARLWRKLAAGELGLHRAALRQRFLKMAERGRISPDGLPRRISIFGISALPPYHVEILAAVSRILDVHLFLMNPCREYWGDIVSDREMKRLLEKGGAPEGAADSLHLETGNSLLASMGAQGRAFLSLLTELECDSIELFEDMHPRDMLSFTQSDILHLRQTGGAEGERQPIAAGDRSIRIHSCHSPMREMEVLHDAVLSQFEEDPGLLPGDILVMTPDIEAYAPFIQAVFDSPKEDRKRIPFTIADRSLKSEGQVAKAFLIIMDMCSGRFTAREVLSLLECAPVREKFELSEEEVSLVGRWVREAGIRWGIDARHRQKAGLPPLKNNTWRFGLDRLLLGYALTGGDERTFGGILPYDPVEGGDARVLGSFARFAEGLFSLRRSLEKERTLEDWSECLERLIERFFLSSDEREREIQTLRDALRDLQRQQELSGFRERLGLEAIAAFLKGRLEAAVPGLGFITGGVTFCAMLPMRSIPFKVICLVGMNSDTYPRQARALGFDLMAGQPRRGDRSLRDEDRYLFLEALLCARQTLYISYVGQSIRDNSEIPPSVLVSELLDCLEQGFTTPEEQVADHVLTRHRLQAFSPYYFTGKGKLFTYSTENLEAALCGAKERKAPGPFLAQGLSEAPADWREVSPDRLAAFLANPARFILKERMGIRLRGKEGIPEESEAFVLDGLERYQLERMLVQKGMSGFDLKGIRSSVEASGRLPLGTPGRWAYEGLRHGVEAFVDEMGTCRGSRSAQPFHVDLGLGAFRLTGPIRDIYEDLLIHYRYANLKARDHLRIWVHHLALNALNQGSRSGAGLLVGKGMKWEYAPVQEAETILKGLLELYWEGLQRPALFFPESSLRYAHHLVERADTEESALAKARSTWNGSPFARGECEDEYYRVCFGDAAPLDGVFKELAEMVFTPLLKARHGHRI
jgi:exodeoxyribonuclease V gamma subunit